MFKVEVLENLKVVYCKQFETLEAAQEDYASIVDLITGEKQFEIDFASIIYDVFLKVKFNAGYETIMDASEI